MLAEPSLSQFPHTSSLNTEDYIKYIEARRKEDTELRSYYFNETQEKSPTYHLEPLDFIVERKGDVYYGKCLLFIQRVQDASPGVADLNAYIRYLTIIMLTKHHFQRISKEDIDHLNKIIIEISA